MKKLMFLVLSGWFTLGAVEQISLEKVQAAQFEKMRIVLGVMQDDGDVQKVTALLKHDLEFTGQFTVEVEKVSSPPTKKNQVKDWFEKGYPLALYVKPIANGYEWYVYDTARTELVNGKKIKRPGLAVRAMAHVLADDLWNELTGSPGFFSTKIVYGKEVCRRGRNCKKYIYMRDATDLEGVSEELLVASPTISVSPRWNRDLNNPLVLYSEYTKTNVRLIAVNMQGKRRVVSNFAGVNMQAAYSFDGQEVVYCLSRAPGSSMKQHTTSQLYHYAVDPETGEAGLVRLTSNSGNNFAPCWGPNNTLFYVSDASKNGLPNICWYDFAQKKMAWVTEGGYSTSPSYNAITHKLAYTKMVDKVMQLFEFDIATQKHRQLTFDGANKDDCSWSPCGTMIVYSSDLKGKNRLALFNVNIGQEIFLTGASEDCSYPCWSPRYTQLPKVA